MPSEYIALQINRYYRVDFKFFVYIFEKGTAQSHMKSWSWRTPKSWRFLQSNWTLTHLPSSQLLPECKVESVPILAELQNWALFFSRGRREMSLHRSEVMWCMDFPILEGVFLCNVLNKLWPFFLTCLVPVSEMCEMSLKRLVEGKFIFKKTWAWPHLYYVSSACMLIIQWLVHFLLK